MQNIKYAALLVLIVGIIFSCIGGVEWVATKALYGQWGLFNYERAICSKVTAVELSDELSTNSQLNRVITLEGYKLSKFIVAMPEITPGKFVQVHVNYALMEKPKDFVGEKIATSAKIVNACEENK